jgi:tetratricopeptide (TPR) repeat protein
MSGSRRPRRGLVGLALVGFVVARGGPAAGGRLSNFSQEELRTLPRLCLAQQFINEELESPIVPEPERKRLAEQLGHSFVHYHHYCWALLYERRAAQPGGDKFDYRRAVDNLNYVTRHADPSFALLPEVYFQKGKVLERLGERTAAVTEYQNAVRAKAGYTPASAALVESYLELGDVEAARAALEEGLKHDPKSKTLAAQKSAVAQREKESR